MLITEEIQVINQYNFFLHCLQRIVVHIYKSFVTTELFCRRSRVPKSAAGKPFHTPLRQSWPYGPRACLLTRPSLLVDPFSDGQLSKVSARPRVFWWTFRLKQFLVSIINLDISFHPLMPMLSSYMSLATLLFVDLGSSKEYLTPSSSAKCRGVFSISCVCLLLCVWLFYLPDHGSSNLVLQMGCHIFFVSYSCSEG